MSRHAPIYGAIIGLAMLAGSLALWWHTHTEVATEPTEPTASPES